jgi:hypothetical protein
MGENLALKLLKPINLAVGANKNFTAFKTGFGGASVVGYESNLLPNTAS